MLELRSGKGSRVRRVRVPLPLPEGDARVCGSAGGHFLLFLRINALTMNEAAGGRLPPVSWSGPDARPRLCVQVSRV